VDNQRRVPQPYHQSDPGFGKKFLADFTVAPIIEVASGRPYNILIGTNPNLDLGTATNRPDVFPSGKVRRACRWSILPS